jgi:hypothetical protein
LRIRFMEVSKHHAVAVTQSPFWLPGCCQAFPSWAWNEMALAPPALEAQLIQLPNCPASFKASAGQLGLDRPVDGGVSLEHAASAGNSRSLINPRAVSPAFPDCMHTSRPGILGNHPTLFFKSLMLS